jgi:hypothetical protein
MFQIQGLEFRVLIFGIHLAMTERFLDTVF